MKTYHWSCPHCGIGKQPAKDSGDAMAKLEIHEKEAHKGKPVGSFGWSAPT
jgi:phage terminase large subunit GpA-like protein